MRLMKATAGLLGTIVALLCAGCASGGVGADPAGPIEVRVDNSTDWPVVLRIAGLRIGEAKPTGRTILRAPRAVIAGRAVTVCVDPIGSNRVRCHPGQLLVPGLVQEIWVTVPRFGRVRASAL
jgi:hypothetical protein